MSAYSNRIDMLASPEWTQFAGSEFPGAWGDLIGFRPPASVQKRISHGPLRAQIQAIEKGWGPINLDYYPIRIGRFPWDIHGIRPAGGRHDPKSLVELFRRFLITFQQNLLFDPSLARFSAFNNEEALRWATGDALGSLVHIDMGFHGANPDDGSVVCSYASPDAFRVSTVWVADDGFHPVSGNREFGIWRSGKNSAKGISRIDWETGRHHRLRVDEWTFYTRGADRLGSAFHGNLAMRALVFAGAEGLWNSMRERFTALINDNGGLAVTPPAVSQRVPWEDVSRLYWAPKGNWVVPTT